MILAIVTATVLLYVVGTVLMLALCAAAGDSD